MPSSSAWSFGPLTADLPTQGITHEASSRRDLGRDVFVAASSSVAGLITQALQSDPNPLFDGVSLTGLALYALHKDDQPPFAISNFQ